MTLIEDPLVREVIGCAIAVHRALGPGLLEGANERCLGIEFRHRQISYASQVAVPLRYREVDAGCAYRVDFLVEGRLVVEVKSVSKRHHSFVGQEGMKDVLRDVLHEE